jgi:glucans biosynthesis protein C
VARLYELDALRSFCMLYGIFFHAHCVAQTRVSGVLFEASGFFRMSTFFFVSAFFTALLLSRRGVAQALWSRAVALGVPLIVTFLTLVPLAKWGLHSLAVLPEAPVAFAQLYVKSITFELSGAYLHLWFLVVLLVYLPTAPVLVLALRQPRVLRVLDGIVAILPERGRVLALALAVGTACGLSLIAAKFLLPSRALSSLLVVGCFFNYPFYVMGIAAFVFRERFGSLIRIDLPAIALALICAVFVLSVGAVERVPAVWFAYGAANAVAALTLTAIFTRFFSRPGPWLAFLSRSVYSVYLVHFTFIALFGLAFARLGAEGPLLYWLVVAATMLSAFLFHALVDRVSWLTFLYNGRVRAPLVAPPLPVLAR